MTDRAVGKRQIPESEPRAKSRLNRRTFASAAIGAAAAAGAAGLTGWSAQRHNEHGHDPALQLTHRIVAPRIEGAVPRDPTAAAWQSAEAAALPLLQQYMVAPRLQPEGLIPLANLKAMHNGREIAFLVSWGDTSTSDLEAAGRFRDSVAVQLPLDPEDLTSTVMGQPGRPVHILHWRASWQRTVQKGPRTIQDIYPNAVNDFPPEKLLGEDGARPFYPAVFAGNALAQRERKSAVEELVAVGYGTITPHEQQRAEGTGVYTGGRWEVTLVMPMAGGVRLPVLRAGVSTRVAVAIWDGGKGDRGARKQFANWSALELS